MTYPLRMLLLALTCLCGARCTSEVTVPARTQLLLRIDIQDDFIRRSIESLSVRLFADNQGTWKPGSQEEYAKRELVWPVDLPVIPRAKSNLRRPFEVVVQARGEGRVLAETRGVVQFAEGRKVVLTLRLEQCAAAESLGPCAAADCHGADCKVCRKGSCTEVGLVDGNDLPPWSGTEIDIDDARADAGPADAHSDAQSDAAEVSADATGIADAATTRDARAVPPAICRAEGMLRCEPTARNARQRCTDGVWVNSEPCPGDQVCDQDDALASCRELSPACVGHPGETVCDGSLMQFCNDASEPARTLSCASERHCALGKASGRCAECLPGQFRCMETDLQVCSDDGSSFQLSERCSSASLCNEVAGSCGMGCRPGTKTCVATNSGAATQSRGS